MESASVSPGVRRHTLSAESFAVLSKGDGTAEITRDFWRTERDRRRLLLTMVLHEIAEHPAKPLPTVTTVWDLLSLAERIDPDGVSSVCVDPQVGSWAAYTLRRLRGGARGIDPLRVDCGGAHGLALAVAARVGLSWSTELPIRAGHAFIPTRGMARLPLGTSDTTVGARTENGQIWLGTRTAELRIPMDEIDVDVDGERLGWWPLRRVSVVSEPPLQICLDDLSPYRDLADPVPPVRLDPAAVQRWTALTHAAWHLLARDHRPDAEAIAPGLISLIPLPTEAGWGTRSASNGEAFGSVMISEPPDPETLAVSIVHEFQHTKLGALLHLLAFTEADDSLYYAPWRDDPRPLPGLLQGVYAFLGIARFWRDRAPVTEGADARLATFEYVYAREQTREAAQIVMRAPGLSGLGTDFVRGLITTLDEWASDPIDARTQRLVGLVAESHRIGWRLRHHHPHSEDVTELAKAWMTPESELPVRSWEALSSSHPDLRWEQGLPPAVRRHVFDDHTAVEPSASGTDIDDAELALINGDVDRARAGFLAVIEQGDSARTKSNVDVRAWVGLALSTDGEAARMLRERPDLVYAVWAELRPVDASCTPPLLAEWIGRAFLRTA